jgi:putative ABC transport system substrate-binding protein
MKRRDFITIIVGATFWPLGTSAQPIDRTRRVGVLMGGAQAKSTEALLGAFLRRLDQLGWKNGTNILTDVRWWTDNSEEVRAAVTELVSVSPDVIVAWTNLAVVALKPVAGKFTKKDCA